MSYTATHHTGDLLLHAAEEKLIWIHPPLAPGDNEFGDAAPLGVPEEPA